jgi:hypothetical protein
MENPFRKEKIPMKSLRFTKPMGIVFAGVVLVLGLGFVLFIQTEETPADGIQEKTLDGIKYQPQRKDTKLLCLDGCYSERDKTDDAKDKYWDREQPGRGLDDHHGGGNCGRASISMMVSFYGKRLSQDRIAYYMEEERPFAGDGLPEGDLAHGKGMLYSESTGGDETIALEWALNEKVTFMHGAPEFENVKAWLDDNRPIMIRRINYSGFQGFNHISIICGYRLASPDSDEVPQVRIFDPLIKNDFYGGWVSYDSLKPGEDDKKEMIEGIWVGPVSAPNAREDEESIWKDTDNDGVMDFDEQKRFFTDKSKKDSDQDGVSDKNDIREYVFNAQNKYDKRDADWDNDGLRKELDPDNDNDLALDGCEDSNQNGTYEPLLGETNNFNSRERPAMCIGSPNHKISDPERPGSIVYPSSAPMNDLNKPEAE